MFINKILNIIVTFYCFLLHVKCSSYGRMGGGRVQGRGWWSSMANIGIVNKSNKQVRQELIKYIEINIPCKIR